jgi:hypothetical protein
MKHAYFDPTTLEEILSFSELDNIKEFKIGALNIGYHEEWDSPDLRRMTQVIEAHLPDQEILHWTRHDWDRENGEPKGFGSFKGLSKLRELKVDVHLLRTGDPGSQRGEFVTPYPF